MLGRDEVDRRRMVNTIGPVWDGNEVWLLVAGGATFAAFPQWYATLFSGFYLALLIILVALIGRGVAFEYRGKVDDPRWRRRWDYVIMAGSALPALLWGVAFGNIVHGVPLDAQHEYTGTLLTLLNPYALLGGLTTLGVFLLHGAVFIALRTDGELRARAVRTALWISAAAIPVAAVFLGWTEVAPRRRVDPDPGRGGRARAHRLRAGRRPGPRGVGVRRDGARDRRDDRDAVRGRSTRTCCPRPSTPRAR